MPSALYDTARFDLKTLTPVGVEDMKFDDAKGDKNIPGGIVFLQNVWGPKVFRYIRNKGGATVVHGTLLSCIGNNNGITQITTSGAAAVNTTTKATTSGLVANKHAGSGAYVVNSVAAAGAAPEGEESLVVSNTATLVNFDSRLPFSATITSGDTIDLVGLYTAEASAIGDLAYSVLGVVIPDGGIRDDYWGWVQMQGHCSSALVKAATALTLGDAVVADAGRVGPAAGGTAAGNLHVGSALHVLNSDSVPDKTSILLTLGWGFNPATLDVSA